MQDGPFASNGQNGLLQSRPGPYIQAIDGDRNPSDTPSSPYMDCRRFCNDIARWDFPVVDVSIAVVGYSPDVDSPETDGKIKDHRTHGSLYDNKAARGPAVKRTAMVEIIDIPEPEGTISSRQRTDNHTMPRPAVGDDHGAMSPVSLGGFHIYNSHRQ
jgi:hypothetical protein